MPYDKLTSFDQKAIHVQAFRGRAMKNIAADYNLTFKETRTILTLARGRQVSSQSGCACWQCRQHAHSGDVFCSRACRVEWSRLNVYPLLGVY